MAITPTEGFLGGAILTVFSALGGGAWVARKKVDKSFCAQQHISMDKLLDAKLKPLDDGIKELKQKIDKITGNKNG